jgi:hypothetical protein
MEEIIEELNQDFELQAVSLKQYIMILEPHSKQSRCKMLFKSINFHNFHVYFQSVLWQLNG